MRALVIYTLARLGLFVVAFALVWVVGNPWLTWDTVTVFWTMLVALVVSSVGSLVLLRPLRDRLAVHVAARAERMSARLEESRRAEDVD